MKLLFSAKFLYPYKKNKRKQVFSVIDLKTVNVNEPFNIASYTKKKQQILYYIVTVSPFNLNVQFKCVFFSIHIC